MHEQQHRALILRVGLFLPQIVDFLVKTSKESKARMAEGREPECLLDFWSQRINEELAEATRTGLSLLVAGRR